MIAARVIPVLLIQDQDLVKTVKFRSPVYVGDPRNAVRIFSEREVDELVILDISATAQSRSPQFELIQEIVSEAFVPIAYGGGIRSVEEARTIFSLGVEKVVLNSIAIESPHIVSEMAAAFGSQSVVVCIDVRTSLFGTKQVYGRSGSKASGHQPADFARRMTDLGAGELIVSSIDRDGTRTGYDGELVRSITSLVDVPVVALGGASRIEDLASVVNDYGAAAAAAGSLFVFHGPHQAVLINYPEHDVLNRIFAT